MTSYPVCLFIDDNSRVALQGDMDVIGSDYINANYIDVRTHLHLKEVKVFMSIKQKVYVHIAVFPPKQGNVIYDHPLELFFPFDVVIFKLNKFVFDMVKFKPQITL